jgi:hypothetical protein
VSQSVVVDPAFTFASLGFARDRFVRPVTPDAIRHEPELAAWTRGGERLIYTFNPVVAGGRVSF